MMMFLFQSFNECYDLLDGRFFVLVELGEA
jgi:hypothetical protein